MILVVTRKTDANKCSWVQPLNAECFSAYSFGLGSKIYDYFLAKIDIGAPIFLGVTRIYNK
jgi:hypothetical protein